MYKKQPLYRTALFSSPIMAAFELSPAFFINGESLKHFLAGMVLLTVITLLLWIFNIYILLLFEDKRIEQPWKRTLLSYLFAIVLVALFMIGLMFFVSELHVPPKKPPHSPLFPFINAIALNTIILIIINSMINRSKKEQAESEINILKIKNLEAEQQQLIQQLQPHFLFNALSTLKSLINQNTELAEEYLIKLSDFLRYTISPHANQLVSLEDELKFTCDYIKLQQIRFGNSLFCEITIPDYAKQTFQLPVYALQTLVENAIKHTTFTALKPLKLTIDYKDTCLVVKNSTSPKSTASKNGIGLENLDKRYALIGKGRIAIDHQSDYFAVTIKLIPK